jgi:hypothetical protein
MSGTIWPCARCRGGREDLRDAYATVKSRLAADPDIASYLGCKSEVLQKVFDGFRPDRR